MRIVIELDNADKIVLNEKDISAATFRAILDDTQRVIERIDKAKEKAVKISEVMK